MSDVVQEVGAAETGGESFSDYIAAERARLSEQRSAVVDYIERCQNTLAGIDREFAAIDAYEAAKTGKPAPANTTPARTMRVRKGSRREELLKIIGAADGLKRAEILDIMGLRGDKSGEMAVSNALTALVKRNAVVREGRKYKLTPDAYERGRTYSENTLAEAAE